MWVLEGEYSDLGVAGRGSGKVHCVQCAGGRGFKTRYVSVISGVTNGSGKESNR